MTPSNYITGVKDDTAQQVTETRQKNLNIRILSALAMIPPVLGLTYLGFPYFNILIAAAVTAMAWEWCCMVGGGRFGYDGWILAGGLLVAMAGASMGAYIHAILVLGFVGVLLVAITEYRRLIVKLPVHSKEMVQTIHPKRAMWMAAGAFYIGIPCLSLIWIRTDWDNGMVAVFWLLVLVWAADSGAYAAGRLIGGPKMAPRISPNKTWAGLGGCVVAAAGAGAAVAKVAGLDADGVVNAVVISALIGLVSQGGDLVESAIKRHFKVKDSSSLIPGHGGVLDRVDALLAAIAAAALLGLTNKVNLMS
jgi:phosphatidate cytidylyltransferase